MAKRGFKKKTTRKHGFTLPMAVILGFVPLASRGVSLYKSGGIDGLKSLSSSLVPYDASTGKISFSNLNTGLYPIVAGFLVHKFVGGGLGLNRALGSAGIPWLRI